MRIEENVSVGKDLQQSSRPTASESFPGHQADGCLICEVTSTLANISLAPLYCCRNMEIDLYDLFKISSV